jgi:transcriptional regulator with XRE-family HTH domain
MAEPCEMAVKLKALRNAMGLSEAKFGEKIGEVQQKVGYNEKSVDVGSTYLKKVADAFHFDMNIFMNGTVDEILKSTKYYVKSEKTEGNVKDNTSESTEKHVKSEDTNTESEFAVHGKIKVTVNDYILLREQLAVAKSEAKQIQHQNEVMINGFAETLKNINNYLIKNDNSFQEKTTGQGNQKNDLVKTRSQGRHEQVK